MKSAVYDGDHVLLFTIVYLEFYLDDIAEGT